MAEGIESKTKRVRDLLSSFYGDEEEPAHSSPTLVRRDTLQAINTKAFDADRYMSSLVHRTNLEGLLQKHVEMAAEIKNLDSDMQMLVYENYNKFISATDTIRRMKDNISGMESNVERLLEKITAVRAKSDGINASLFERRERIEELNGTRGLLRKVQFVFDLPIRLRKCLKAEAYGDAVKYYKGALPVLKAYGRTSFQTCKQESDEVIAKITKCLKVRATSVTESVPNRAEAIRLLQELNNPVEEIMEKCLMQELERLSSIIKGFAHLANTALSDSKPQDDSEYRSPRSTIELLSKEFLASFSQSASTFRKIFPIGEERFREAGTELFKKYLESVQKSLDPDFGNSAAKELVAVLKILSTDVPQMDEVLPKAGLSEFALQTAEGSVRQHISKRFKGLFDKLIGVLMVANTSKAGKEPEEFGEKKNMLESLLLDAEDIILQGSRDVLLDLKMLLDDRVNLMIEWRSLYVDLVQGGIQDLFVMLNNHFSVICFPTGHETSKQDKGTEDNKKFPVCSGFVLLLARFSIYVEQTAVPKITEEIAMSFTGGGTRGPEDRPIFVPTEICRLFRATGEQLLDHYISIQLKRLSTLIKKSVTTPNWLNYKEPREVRMFVDLLLQEVETMSGEVKQLLAPGAVRTHRRSDSTGSGGSSRSNTLRDERGSRTSISQKARSRLLERDVARLFKQKVEIFTKLEFTQISVVSAIIKMCLKSFQEYVRLETFSRSGFQQIQVDTQYLREALRDVVDDEAIVNFLLDEVCSAAAERCLDAIPLEPAIVEKLIQARRAKRTENNGS